MRFFEIIPNIDVGSQVSITEELENIFG
jgi:hypothetical protein